MSRGLGATQRKVLQYLADQHEHRADLGTLADHAAGIWCCAECDVFWRDRGRARASKAVYKATQRAVTTLARRGYVRTELVKAARAYHYHTRWTVVHLRVDTMPELAWCPPLTCERCAPESVAADSA